MKKTLFLLLCVVIAACSGDSEPPIVLSQDTFENVAYDQTSVEIDIQTSLKWTATSKASWCKVSQDMGEGNARLTLTFEPNIEKSRTAIIKIWTEAEIIDVTVQQDALPEGEEFHYKLPVIFHVLYKDKNDENQYVSVSRLTKILANVNEYFKGKTKYKGGDDSQDINIEFVLAETDEEGNKLATPGVEYIPVDEMPIDCMVFMDNNSPYKKLLWEPNEYINVMFYNFEAQGESTTLGISHLPYSLTGTNALEGLSTISSNPTKENLSYPHCVSINSLYAYEDFGKEYYNNSDVNVTLAHELGHYLGLHHAFNEDESGESSTNCTDTDYCEDTPPYNREAYWLNLLAYVQENGSISLEEAVLRENCKTGETFSSYNLMDYEFTYADRFTKEQRDRMRHVLTYSPMIPGPKKGKASTRSAVEGIMDLPLVIRK